MARRMQLAFPPLRGGVKTLLIVLGALYVAQLIAWFALGGDEGSYGSAVVDTLYLSSGRVIHGFVWQPFTYMWLHSIEGVGHIAFNALALYIFGAAVEEARGKKSFLIAYVLGGLAGAAAVCLQDLIVPLVVSDARILPVVGASGAVSAIIAAFCGLSWKEWLDFGFTRLKGWHLLLIFAAIDVARALGSGGSISLAAHVGGMIFGLLWILGYLNTRVLRLKLRLIWVRRKIRKKGQNDVTYLH